MRVCVTVKLFVWLALRDCQSVCEACACVRAPAMVRPRVCVWGQHGVWLHVRCGVVRGLAFACICWLCTLMLPVSALRVCAIRVCVATV